MIIDETVFVKVGTKSFKWYKNIGYEFKCGDLIEVKVSDLTEYSSAVVRVECQRCGKIVEKKFYDYKYVTNNSKNGEYFCKACSPELVKETNIVKYGTPCSLQNEKVKIKAKKTLLKIYGVDNISKVESIKDERSLFMKRHTKTYNKIIKEKYGDNVSKLDWVKDKKKKTTMENWGVENPIQNTEIFEKSQKNGKKIKLHKIGIYFRGSYEEHFLDYCCDNNIEVMKGPTIPYVYLDKNRYYHSDFYLPSLNMICEIKSNYYYKKYYEINEAKKLYSEKEYNFLFIIDKNYEHLGKLIEKNK
jgi:hypothetical protein